MMIRIEKANIDDAEKIAHLGKITFMESHGDCAPKDDLEKYLNQNFTEEAFKSELINPKNVYHLLYYKNDLVGYSKIVYNQAISTVSNSNITKLERIYILNSFHKLGLGQKLFDFNIDLAKKNQQLGIWLFVWVENKRAIHFYEKRGFIDVGTHDFKISEGHSNPNWQKYLAF